jgi:5-methylcytosine-specific restriction endonuclease McrA
MKIRICPICKKEFISNISAQKYCSDSCSEYAIKEKKKIYRIIHKKEGNLSMQKYRTNHKIKINQYRKIYYQSSEGIYTSLKAGAKQRNIIFLITKEEFIKWYNSQEQKCCYCKRSWLQIKESNDIYQRDRLAIDRKDNNKGYILGNIILACNRCNSIKSDYFTEKEMLKIGQIIKNRGN